MLHFIAPPLPHYIIGNEDVYAPGGKHVARSDIGVFDLIAVTRGALYMEEDGEEFVIRAGHYGILRPDLAHRSTEGCREETHFFWLHFQTLGTWNEVAEPISRLSPPEDRQFNYELIEPFSFVVPRRNPLSDLAGVDRLMRQLLLLQRNPLAVSRWKQQQLFADLLLKLHNDAGKVENSSALATAEACAAYLRQHYKQTVSYEKLSEALHFHPNYIALCMKKVFGCTPLEFLLRHRVQTARTLLIHTNEPIGTIAEETGFSTAPYFVRCFKRQTGLAPSAFRKQYRSSPNRD